MLHHRPVGRSHCQERRSAAATVKRRTSRSAIDHERVRVCGGGSECRNYSARRTYPTPRMVWIILVSNGSSTLARRRRIMTSTTLVPVSKLISQTCSTISVRETMSPAEEARNKSSENSFGVRVRIVAGARHFVAARIDLQVSDSDCFLAPFGRAAQKRTDPGQQFGKMEWFDEIIVGPEVKAFHPVGHTVARGQKQDRRMNLGLAKLGDERPAIALRERDIEDDQIHFPGERIFQALSRHPPPHRRRSRSPSDRAAERRRSFAHLQQLKRA